MSWAGGYLTDLAYTAHYYPELMPARLRFGALLHGVMPPAIDKPFRYLELGCGRGMSALTVAAAYPHAEVVALDFNPAHIAWAQALADEAGLRNIRLSDASFENFAEDAGAGVFDVVAMHGVWSWVGPAARTTLVRILAERLVPGGFAYLSFNCAPAFAAFTPLQRLLTEIAGAMGEQPAATRMDAALALAMRLRDVGARYFTAHPGVAERLGTLLPGDRAYVAHEYFNRHWEPFSFPDVAAELAIAKLTHVGSMHLLDAIVSLNLTEAQQAVVLEHPPGPTREMVRDLLVNAQFRRDLFVRGPQPLSAERARAEIMATRFALTRTAASVAYRVTGRRGQAALRREVCEPVVLALAAGPQTGQAVLETRPELGFAQVIEGLTLFAADGTIEPCAPGMAASDAAARLNRAVLARAVWDGDAEVLASPVTGGGLRLDRVSLLALLSRGTGVTPGGEEEAAWIWARLQVLDQRVSKDGVALEGDAANLAEIRRLVAVFDEERGPVLPGLGITGLTPDLRSA